MSAELREWEDIGTRTLHVHLTVTEDAMRAMHREQIEMLTDAVWLIKAALRGRVEGPLTLPSGMPAR